MFEKILFPTDFSADSDKAAIYIAKLREAGAKEVLILHVIEEFGFDDILKNCKKAGFDPDDFRKNVLGDITHEKEQAAEPVKTQLERAGLKVMLQIEFGRCHKEICRIAEKENVSLIVMGAQGKGKISAMLLGSVSEGTLRGSKVPVFIVR